MTLRPTNDHRNNSGLPEGEALQAQIRTRRRLAAAWLLLFRLATLVGIVTLVALLYNIIDGATGLAAVENEIDPQTLALRAHRRSMLAASNTTASEDDEALAAGIAADPYAVGFFGYSYYAEHAGALALVTVDSVTPSAESVGDGSYPLARPLYLYSAPQILQQKPQVAAFLDYALANSSSLSEEAGFLPPDEAALAEARAALPQAALAAGPIAVTGSSTMQPLVEQMAAGFKASGFDGTIMVEAPGTRRGFQELCSLKAADIVSASRAINRYETAACRKNRLTPLGMHVGTDAVAVVVSRENTWLTDATQAQLQQLFTMAQLWSDVDPSWPAKPVVRFIPGEESGTLDFFIESLFPLEMSAIPRQTQQALLVENISAGLLRRFEHERPLDERSDAEITALLVERVIEPQVVASWNMTESLLNRAGIEEEVAQKYPSAVIEWRNWLTWDFVTSTQSSNAQDAGVRTAILGSLWVILITVLVSVPVGIGAAIYLEEYAGRSRLSALIQTNIDNLAGVPSIIYGILGLAIFVRAFSGLTSGAIFGFGDDATANGRTILSAGLTMALLVLPVIIINAQEAIRAVPSSLREAAYGLGATKWQVIWSHVLTNALPGILTGTIFAMSRAVGETAPLIVIGASTYITMDPNGPFSKFTVLPMQIYQWTSRPQAEFRHIAAAASIVLLLLLFALNGAAIWLRNRQTKRN